MTILTLVWLANCKDVTLPPKPPDIPNGLPIVYKKTIIQQIQMIPAMVLQMHDACVGSAGLSPQRQTTTCSEISGFMKSYLPWVRPFHLGCSLCWSKSGVLTILLFNCQNTHMFALCVHTCIWHNSYARIASTEAAREIYASDLMKSHVIWCMFLQLLCWLKV